MSASVACLTCGSGRLVVGVARSTALLYCLDCKCGYSISLTRDERVNLAAHRAKHGCQMLEA